jgi:peptidoglycan/LPS O-acetylase OafA/YrhL
VIAGVDRPATWGGALTAAVETMAVATAVYLLVERPANRLGRVITRRLERTPLSPPDLDRDVTGMPVAYAAMVIDPQAVSGSGHG